MAILIKGGTILSGGERRENPGLYSRMERLPGQRRPNPPGYWTQGAAISSLDWWISIPTAL